MKKMNEDDSLVVKIKTLAQIALAERKDQSVSHQFDHGERVWKRGKHLAPEVMKERKVVIDLKALRIASYLHDINESYKGNKGDHVATSMEGADEIMTEAGCSAKLRQKVLTICSEHSSENIKKSTLPESDVLFDADKLDGLGAIGIARVFMLCGQQGLSIAEAVDWYRAKIEKAIPHMKTKIGKEIAERQLKDVLEFLDQIKFEKETLEAI